MWGGGGNNHHLEVEVLNNAGCLTDNCFFDGYYKDTEL